MPPADGDHLDSGQKTIRRGSYTILVRSPNRFPDSRRTARTLYPVWTSPRLVAGGPMANDIIKCRLRPVDPAEYGAPLTTGQVERLRRIFPGGVCDWSAKGVWQQGISGTWQSFNRRPSSGPAHRTRMISVSRTGVSAERLPRPGHGSGRAQQVRR
jgi:hypothetical protein